jgi:hypothetical protein
MSSPEHLKHDEQKVVDSFRSIKEHKYGEILVKVKDGVMVVLNVTKKEDLGGNPLREPRV